MGDKSDQIKNNNDKIKCSMLSPTNKIKRQMTHSNTFLFIQWRDTTLALNTYYM